MIYAGFAGPDKSNLIFMPKGKRKAVDFVRLCYEGEDGLQAFCNCINIPDAILMEDGAPVHRSTVSKIWCKTQGLEKLNWPANSPDLNLIENVWDLLKDAIQHHHVKPKNIIKMKEALKEEWDKISSGMLMKLLESMPERMKAVIKVKGGHTRW